MKWLNNFLTAQGQEQEQLVTLGHTGLNYSQYSLPVAEPSLLVSVFSLEEKGNGRENSVPWSGGQPAIMQRRSRPHLRINGHRARQLQC